MFSYKEIFNNRADLYHKAMEKYPNARDEEFTLLLEILNPKSGDIIIDIPSGGEYLAYRIPSDTKLYSIDPSESFCSVKSDFIINSSIENTPFNDNYVDGIFCLSGLHHLNDRTNFYKESFRILKSNGTLAIADVALGSNVDGFLNIFVDSVNTMGHKGIFLDTKNIEILQNIGFLVSFELKKFFWKFDTIDSMAEFCSYLFGTNCSKQIMIENIKKYLGYKVVSPNEILLNWELMYIKAKKI